MIYLVCNIHRSGSSMMMRCLEAGGLSPVYDADADKMNESAPEDYIPNPNGFYQFGNEIGEGFAGYDGRVIKCPIQQIVKLPIGNYKMVVLKRNPVEIRTSMARWTPYRSWGRQESLTYIYDWYLARVAEMVAARGDIQVTILNYADIVANPTAEFTKLAGWGINVAACAAMVDSSLYRLRLEEA